MVAARAVTPDEKEICALDGFQDPNAPSTPQKEKRRMGGADDGWAIGPFCTMHPGRDE